MPKILVMTDLHILPPEGRIIGLDPSKRLESVLDHAARAHPDADRLILMGDLTHHGTAEEYAGLARLLEGRPWPVSLMIGNHDDRATFRAAFPDAATDEDGFVQSVVDFDCLRLILLDTVDPDALPRHSGRLCARRRAWLDAALSSADGRTCLVFMHHPPFLSGLEGMDRIALQDAKDVCDTFRAGSVAHVFAGHIHRTIHATASGVPITVLKSPCHQMPMVLGPSSSDDSVDEPGGYGIVLCNDADVVVHFADVLLP